jgi:hypothetical protein
MQIEYSFVSSFAHLYHMLPLLLPQHLVHKLLLHLLTVAPLFSLCLARGRPPSWIRLPPLLSRLTRFPSSKMWTWFNSCSIPRLPEVPSPHIRASKSSLPKFVSFLFLIFLTRFLLVLFVFSFLLLSHEVLFAGWGKSFPCEHLDHNPQGPRFALRRHSREFAGAIVWLLIISLRV